MGSCPCPRCLTPKNSFNLLGLLKDMKSQVTRLRVYSVTNIVRAREYIYKWGNTVDGTKVQEMLGEGSWVPILVCASRHDASLSHLLIRAPVE